MGGPFSQDSTQGNVLLLLTTRMAAADDIMLLPGAEGFETWRTKGLPDAAPEPGVKARRAAWIGLPMRSVVSFPMRFHGGDASRLESAVKLELETLGLGGEDTAPHLFEVRAEAGDETRDQKGWAVVQAAPLPKEALDTGLDARYAPSVSFFNLDPGRAQVWSEGGGLALALPDEKGRPLHAQALTSHEPDADAAAEIRCILAAAELAGAAPEVESVALRVGDTGGGTASRLALEDFSAGLDFPVVPGAAAARPKPPSAAWRLVPQSVLDQRLARKQRQTIFLAATMIVAALVAALGAFAAGLWKRQQEQAGEEARLAAMEPQLEEIRFSRDKWMSLQGALTPGEYPVELFFQLVQLLPPEGIRLTLFELNEEKLTLAGEASSIQHANNFREELSSKPAFREWGFADGFPTPEVMPDNRAQFRAEGRRPSFAASTP